MAGTSYTRQSTIADGNLITAALFNNEFNQIVNAFAYSASGTTGHTHDGSAGQGGAIAKIGDQDFKNKIEVSATNNRIEFYSEVSGAPVEQVRIQDGAIVPVTNSDVDLGTTSVRFKDAFVDSVTVTNNIVVAGTVDGRDVATDGTKLDGIEASATADQTDAEIRAAVEAATDSNVFTDADHTKLNAIEASADVTDTTNVTAAGALMDSEVTNLAQVKAFDSADYATAAQGTTADAALPKAGGAMTGAITTNSTFDGRDVATDGTKLDGIEAGADVTDTTNVTAAGALMDSEVTNLAQVKAFDSSDYATAAQGTTADAALPKAGGAMTGAITTNSTFDGRDVATDGTKLDGIEASADVTDTTNVVASLTAGSNITIAADGTIASTASGGGETLQQTLAIGNTTTTDTKIQFRDTGLYINSSADGQLDIVADTEVQIAATTVDVNGILDVSGNIVAGGTVDGRDVATDGTKLDGIEASADVTDTANVTAAGALMDSELTSIASVKALNQGVATTDSPTFDDGTFTGTLSITPTSGFGNIEVGGVDGAFIDLKSPSSDDYDMRMITTGGNGGTIDVGATGDLSFNAGGSERVRLLSTGQVGIGTNSPSTYGGKLNITDAAVGGESTLVIANNNANQFVRVGINDNIAQIAYDNADSLAFGEATDSTTSGLTTERMRIDSLGNVGIGTTSPSFKLDVAGNARASYLALRSNESAPSESAFVYRPATGILGFGTSSAERMRIDSSGRVAIGTTTTSTGICVIEGGTTSAPCLSLLKNSATGAILNIGNIAGAASNFTIGAYNNVTSLDAYSASGGSAQHLTFRRGSSGETMRCASNGRVGIGTTAPAEALHVVGNIVATGNITANYSDNRLKDFQGTIPNALNKVAQLNGYYYTPNETAQSLGVDNNGLEVGISAQEVEAVLPEIVAKSAIGEDYKTVMYEKLTPLLIEAVKELTEKVEKLEARLIEMEK